MFFEGTILALDRSHLIGAKHFGGGGSICSTGFFSVNFPRSIYLLYSVCVVSLESLSGVEYRIKNILFNFPFLRGLKRRFKIATQV